MHPTKNARGRAAAGFSRNSCTFVCGNLLLTSSRAVDPRRWMHNLAIFLARSRPDAIVDGGARYETRAGLSPSHQRNGGAPAMWRLGGAIGTVGSRQADVRVHARMQPVGNGRGTQQARHQCVDTNASGCALKAGAKFRVHLGLRVRRVSFGGLR